MSSAPPDEHDEELASIVRDFRASLSERVAGMRSEAALAQQGGPQEAEHREALRTYAHRLRGTAGSFGLPQLGEVARVIENECKAVPNWDAVYAAIDAIEAAIPR